MERLTISRRHFLGSSALASAAVVSARAVSAAAGIKPSDLPDLTIKEVKVSVVKDFSHVVSVTTSSGVEGCYTIRNLDSESNVTGWLESAKLLVGKSALDRPSFTSKWAPKDRINHGTPPHASAIDICLWDVVGKAVGLPIYQILGACRNRLQAYASSQPLNTVEEFVDSALKAKVDGFKMYKIHPPYIPPRNMSVYIRGKVPSSGCDYRLDMEVCKGIRKAVGDNYMLMFDRVGRYTRQEALTVGRLLDELKFIGYEDPLPSTDIEGLAELNRRLDIPLHIGEFVNSLYDFGEYIRQGAVGVLRFNLPNIGGITEGMKIASLAECFDMECAPHNWGDTLEQAAHFHCELAMPNSFMFEMPYPQGWLEPPYMKDRIRITKDGYVDAPSKAGLGYEIDRNALDNMTVRIAT